MWELLLSPGSDGNSDQNQRWLMSDTFTEVTSIYYSEVGGSRAQQVYNGRDSNDGRCMSSAGVNDLSSCALLSK